ncbi:hypothetical protein LIER_13412 [Lithospermum erythrorhizon]|uniref:Gnk2-homologous domain-containing protein n=1 Tax=Lithospermum erythrorhizon TaxID=34254 RepID=A0AAV3PW74_LITER
MVTLYKQARNLDYQTSDCEVLTNKVADRIFHLNIESCNQYNASSNLSSGLNATFSDLRRQLLHDEKHFATAESSSHEEMVFTNVQCRNYLSTEDCVNCFDAAKFELENCSFAGNGAWVIYDGCFLRYEDTFFYEQTTLPGTDAN